jgi:hypothetical protein
MMIPDGLQFHPTIALIKNHLVRYPVMQIQDVYKLLYQGEFGVGHIIHDLATARGCLVSELNQVSGKSSEPLSEVISPDNAMIRTHLRPFKAKQLDPETLLQAMMKTTRSMMPDTARFIGYWKVVMQAIHHRLLPFSVREADDFWKEMQQQGFPAIHHSKEYQEAYHPAYRVIKAEYLNQILH